MVMNLAIIEILGSHFLGKRNHQFKVENLSRFLVYILGHRPDEFGLIPDSDGFVTYKSLLQAIHEEPDWHYVRRSHINEVLLGKDRHVFQPGENRVRTAERRWHFDMEKPSQPLQKLLFTPIRRKAHPVVVEKGLRSGQGRYLVLSPDREMAGRIGRRRDQKPVLLEVMADAAQSEGGLFYPFGNLFLSPEIPARFITGPPVPKEILESHRDTEPKKEKVIPRQAVLTPGTFPLDSSRDPDPYRRTKGKKRKGWKEEARGMRRGKRR
jgi:putative RNA 2'-phosphotransferase